MTLLQQRLIRRWSFSGLAYPYYKYSPTPYNQGVVLGEL